MSSKEIKHLGINITNTVKDLYHGNCEITKRKTEETTRWKYLSNSWIEKINIVKMAIPLKTTYRLKDNSLEIPDIFHRSREIKSQILRKAKQTLYSHPSSPEQNINARAVILPTFKLNNIIVTKTSWYEYKMRYVDQ